VQSKQLAANGGQRTFALVFDTGDEVMGGLKLFAERERLSAAQFSAIGAFSDAVLGYFDVEKKDYERISVGEQVEVASLNGDVALAPDGSRAIHVHCVLGRRDGAALAGHLLEAHVRPTLEVILTESPAHLQKRHDAATGVALIRLDAEGD
jgi:predicted DNA-binding protein with PD1-like motif